MLRDAQNLEEGTVLTADLCIVGAGAAGIVLARELRGSGLTVCVLESGGLEPEEQTQKLYRGTNLDERHQISLEDCRTRQFGGSTHCWGGWCKPLEADDFEKRDWFPGSGWPVTLQDLAPYFVRAHHNVNIGAYEYDAVPIAKRSKLQLLPLDAARVNTVLYQFSRARFAESYRKDLEDAKDVTVFLHANLQTIVLNDTGSDVAQLSCAVLGGKRFTVQAKRYVLAMGGIENVRVMLASNQQETKGVGNRNDLVGRYFMEHLHVFRDAYMILADAPSLELYTKRKRARTKDKNKPKSIRTRVRGALSLPLEVRRKHKLLAQAATLRDMNLDEIEDKPVRGIPFQKLRGLFQDKPQFSFYGLDIRAEQFPHAESRITLGDERDPLGMPRLQIRWKVTSADYDSIKRTLELTAAELGRAGIGRLWIPLTEDGAYEPRKVSGGCHHMGTTRMDVDPTKGVVDAQCKVHGLGNLYVAGSSVFPTGGFANPTLTILALTHRLADHLKEKR